jgi:hypothetical protein
MKRLDTPSRSATRVAAIALGAALAGGAAEAYDDGAGHRWAQVAATQGLSWNQIAAVCALDGITACAGSAGGRDLSGWVWATQQQVLDLFNQSLAPAQALTPEAPGIGGFEGFFAAQSFVGPVMAPTWSFCITYACGAYLSGWMAHESDGLGGVAGVSWNTTPVTIDGSMAAGGLADPASAPFANGVWLWQPTAAVAEPASTTLMLAGLAGLGWWLRRRHSAG